MDESIVSMSGLLASMDAHGIEKTALIASLNPVLEITFMTRFGTPFLRRMLVSKNSMMRKAVRSLYAGMVKEGGAVDVGGRVYQVKVQPRNDTVMDIVSSRPDRFMGWIFINPMGPVDPVSEIERCAELSGMIGVKAHPYWHDYEISRLKEAAALCEKKGMPMLVHLGTGKNGDFKKLPESYPGLKVIFAHAGVPYQREVCKYAATKDNVFVDLSSPAYVDLRIASLAIKAAGPDKCLFGSDGPYFHHHDDRFDYRPVLNFVRALGLSVEDSAKVMGGNFQRILEV